MLGAAGLPSAAARNVHRFLAWYDNALRTRPLLTKCTSSGVIMGCCELVSQTVSTKDQTARREPAGALSSSKLQEGWKIGHVNVVHVASFGLLSGALYLAPMMHTFYKFTAAWPIPKRIVVNSLAIDPMNYAMAMSINSIAHGEGLDRGIETVQSKLVQTTLTGFCIWPAAQLVNFYLVPLHWRVLFFNTVSLFWNSWLAWSVSEHLSSSQHKTLGKDHASEMCSQAASHSVTGLSSTAPSIK